MSSGKGFRSLSGSSIQRRGKRRLWKEIHESNPGFDSAFKIGVTPDGRSYAYSWNRNLSELYLVDGLM